MITRLSLTTSRALMVAAFCFSCLSAGVAQTATVTKVEAIEGTAPLAMSVGGRVLVEKDTANQAFGGEKYTYQWPGIYFAASFKGTEANFRVGEGKQILHVVADQQAPVVLTKPETGIYRVSGLTDGAHTVRIELVTESQAGPNTFGGFSLPSSSSPLPAPHEKRQMEFIGDSHTVGYGNTSAKHECTEEEVWETTDNSLAYGPLMARYYGADYQINAISGRGIVRNYNGSPGDPLPVAYPYVLYDKQDLYTDSSWSPQIVVLALGTNDFSTKLNPGEKWKTREQLHADYEAAYVAFLKKLRARHPDAYFILWATDLAEGEIQAEAQKVSSQMQTSGDTRVAFIAVNGLAMSGCHWHPSAKDDEVVAGKLIEFIEQHPQVWQQH
jgi:lysophospholipase L1-like esterase